MKKEKTIEDILKTLTDEQMRAVSAFTAIVVREELKKHGIEVEADEQE